MSTRATERVGACTARIAAAEGTLPKPTVTAQALGVLEVQATERADGGPDAQAAET